MLSASRIGPPRALPFLPPSLLRPEQPLRAIAVGWATAFLPSILLAALVGWLFAGGGQPKFPGGSWMIVVLVVVISPVVETLIMGGVLELLRRLVAPVWAALLSAALWGLAHSALAPAWGLVIWWPFLVFSILFLTWRARGFVAAVALVASVHALHNLLPALLLLSGSAGR